MVTLWPYGEVVVYNNKLAPDYVLAQQLIADTPFSNTTVTSFTQSDCTAPFVSTAQSPRIQPCTPHQPHIFNLTTAKVSNDLSCYCFYYV